MNAQEIFEEATKHGLRLEPAGNKLAVIPAKHCPPEFANVLREHKGEILDWLNRSPCPGWGSVPPDDLPLVSVMSRPASHNRERIIGHLLRQTGGRTGTLAAWLVRRELAYYAGPGRTWDCALHAYAAARDAACWQFNRRECDLWELLAGFDETPARSL